MSDVFGGEREMDKAFEKLNANLDRKVRAWQFAPVLWFVSVFGTIVGLIIVMMSFPASASMRDIGSKAAKEANIKMQEREKELINSQNQAICDLVQYINEGRYRGKSVVLAYEPPCIEDEE
jgi:hypothetical protein